MADKEGPILVTGTVGFIASRVAELLLESGRRVLGVDNFSDAYDNSLKDWRLKQLERFGDLFEFHRLDITEMTAFRKVVEDFHKKYQIVGVIHLAARAGVRYSVENPFIYVDTNVTGTLNVLELCRHLGINKLVNASTSSLYGGLNPPFKEDQVTDSPLSPYAASKKGAEAMCFTYHHLHKLDISVMRYFTVYGPAGRPDMAPFRFVQWISEGKPVTVFGDGTQSRDFTYVDDIANGTILALKPVGYQVFNLGSDQPVGLMNVINMIEELVENKANIEYKPRHPADPLRTWAVIENAKTILGWKPNFTFEQGIKKTVEWYKANREWASKVETGR